MNKYRNVKTFVDGINFDSKAEASRYTKLKLLEISGKIKNLRLQVPFMLFAGCKDERKCSYIVDFAYEENGKLVVEDVKGYRTKEYIIKRKWFKDKYPDIIFREVKV